MFYRIICKYNPRRKRWTVRECSPRWGFAPLIVLRVTGEIGICSPTQARPYQTIDPHRLHIAAQRMTRNIRWWRGLTWPGIDRATGPDRTAIYLFPASEERPP